MVIRQLVSKVDAERLSQVELMSNETYKKYDGDSNSYSEDQ